MMHVIRTEPDTATDPSSQTATATDSDPVSDTATASDEALERLESSLGRLRRLWDHPPVRDWFQARLDLDAVDAAVYRTLRAVHQASGIDPSINGIANHLRVDASTASRLVERAVNLGLVTKTSAPDDRRRSVLTLAPDGRRRLQELRSLRVEFLRELTFDWDAADIERLTELLDRLDHSADRLPGR